MNNKELILLQEKRIKALLIRQNMILACLKKITKVVFSKEFPMKQLNLGELTNYYTNDKYIEESCEIGKN